MVANLMWVMCQPDHDQSMAVLTEMVQTGLYVQVYMVQTGDICTHGHNETLLMSDRRLTIVRAELTAANKHLNGG